MKTWIKVLLVTLLVGIPAVPLGQMIWPPAGGSGMGSVPAYVIAGLIDINGAFEFRFAAQR